jgi:hypothetical protein
MKIKNKEITALGHDSEKGFVMLFAALSLVMLGGIAALGIDSGYMMVSKAEIQNVADVSSNSGALELARVYGDLGNDTDFKYYTLSSADKTRVVNQINAFSKQNEAAGQPIQIAPSDAEFGHYDGNNFVQSDTGVRSVRVKARRDENVNGVVTTLMASVLGRDNFSVTGDSAGALSGAASLKAGKADVPIGIDESWFGLHDSPCGGDSRIDFHPTGTPQGCAGWHTFTSAPANASKLKSIIRGMKDGSFSSPEFQVGEDSFMFTGGTVNSALRDFEDLYQANKDAAGEWLVHLPVYASQDCSNPSGWIKIVGVAAATITNVTASGGGSNKSSSSTGKAGVEARVSCSITRFAEPGGPDFGTLSSRPQLKY